MSAIPRRPIKTERLVLQPASVAQVPALVKAIDASRPHLARFLGWASVNRFEDTLRVMARLEPAWEEGSAFHFVIVHAGVASGMVSLRRNQDMPSEGNVGYWIAESICGRGLMTEAVTALVEFGFRTVGLHRIELRADVENGASQRVAEKVGMRREGRARGALVRPPGDAHDAFLYGMVAGDPRNDLGTGDSRRPKGAPEVTEPDFSRRLVTAVVQDELDGTVLMVAYMDREAYERTRKTGHAWFWSRSRERLWEKGETSGNFLDVESVTIDCDGDAVLLKAAPAGPACHTGARSCFHNPV